MDFDLFCQLYDLVHFFDELAILCNFVNFIVVYLMNSSALYSCPCFGIDELVAFTISSVL